MNLTVDLQVATEEDDRPPPERPSSEHIEQWIRATLDGRLEEAELTVRVVDEQEITELNRTYRHKDKATNVLSFPADLPEGIDLPLLGDVVICAAVVNREAEEQHKASQDHWAHMLIHGSLHLLGYDHIDEQDAELMEALEIEILAGLGIANPYQLAEDVSCTPANSLSTTMATRP